MPCDGRHAGITSAAMVAHINTMANILIACEESQTVCKAFRALGHNAYSCDIQPCSGDQPEWHICDDVKAHLHRGWDLMIGHPPCTHLAVSGARWFKDGSKPLHLQDEAMEFFMDLWHAPINHICLENPISVISSRFRKPNQIIHPWQFGHAEQKATCLWLKNLPKLKHTRIVYDEMMLLPIKERTRIHWLGSNKSKERSKTFQGIADAMASQWSEYLNSKDRMVMQYALHFS